MAKTDKSVNPENDTSKSADVDKQITKEKKVTKPKSKTTTKAIVDVETPGDIINDIDLGDLPAKTRSTIDNENYDFRTVDGIMVGKLMKLGFALKSGCNGYGDWLDKAATKNKTVHNAFKLLGKYKSGVDYFKSNPNSKEVKITTKLRDAAFVVQKFLKSTVGHLSATRERDCVNISSIVSQMQITNAIFIELLMNNELIAGTMQEFESCNTAEDYKESYVELGNITYDILKNIPVIDSDVVHNDELHAIWDITSETVCVHVVNSVINLPDLEKFGVDLVVDIIEYEGSLNA